MPEKSSEKQSINTEWRESVEKLLKKWGEQASCYRYLHYKAFYKFRRKSIGITIPVIILQSVCGSTSIGLNSLFSEEYQHLAQIIVGSVTLATSILVTISNFLQWAELKQSHHTAMIAYGKLSRDIRTTLSLIRTDRPDAGFYLQHCKHNLDRLTEDSPTIPDDIAKKFKKKYNDDTKYTFEKPEVCDGLKEVEIESSSMEMEILNNDYVKKVIAEQIIKSKSDSVTVDVKEEEDEIEEIEEEIGDEDDDNLVKNLSKGVVKEVLKNIESKQD